MTLRMHGPLTKKYLVIKRLFCLTYVALITSFPSLVSTESDAEGLHASESFLMTMFCPRALRKASRFSAFSNWKLPRKGSRPDVEDMLTVQGVGGYDLLKTKVGIWKRRV